MTVTEADIINFAALSGDWNPVRVNVECQRDLVWGEDGPWHGDALSSLGTHTSL